jgi:DHA2 family multidrug resistance protein
MFNLMRNIGGSVGIACGTTYLARQQQVHDAILGRNVFSGDSRTQAVIRGVQANMMAHGADLATAKHQAYGAVWGMVQRQSAMQSFIDTFRGLGVVFLLVLPFLFLMKRPSHGAGPGAGMH